MVLYIKTKTRDYHKERHQHATSNKEHETRNMDVASVHIQDEGTMAMSQAKTHAQGPKGPRDQGFGSDRSGSEQAAIAKQF